MKKNIIASLMIAATIVAALSGCQSTSNEKDGQNTPQDSAAVDGEETIEESPREIEDASEATEEAANVQDLESNTADPGSLPGYIYPGKDPVKKAVCQYIVAELGQYFEPTDVSIPCPMIVEIDESNPEDVLVWGDFWINNYNLNNDVLETTSSGSFPGLMHLKETEEGYEAFSMEMVADGADFAESAKEIFKEHYDALIQVQSDMDGREAMRASIIKDYVDENSIPAAKYQDFGWDPVELSSAEPGLF